MGNRSQTTLVQNSSTPADALMRLLAVPVAVGLFMLALLSCAHRGGNLSDCSDASRFCPEAGVCCDWGTDCGLEGACLIDGGPEDSPEDYYWDWEDVEVSNPGYGCNGIGCGGGGGQTGGGGTGYGRM